MPAHNPFLHLFEADKDVVYLDYSAVTIVEKAFFTYNRAAAQPSNIADAIRTTEDEDESGMGGQMSSTNMGAQASVISNAPQPD